MLDLLLPPKCLGRRGLRYTDNPCRLPVNLCSVINEKSRSHLCVIGAGWQVGGVVMWALTDTAMCIFFFTLCAGLHCKHLAKQLSSLPLALELIIQMFYGFQ